MNLLLTPKYFRYIFLYLGFWNVEEMSDFGLDQIIAARNECARIIALHGDKYLPIFERLEKEITKHEQHNKLLMKAMKIGTQNGTHIGTQLRTLFSTATK